MVSGNVLVLNRSWQAVHVSDVKRALSLVYRDVARVVHPENYSTYDFESWCELSVQHAKSRYIRTVRYKIMIPEIILLSLYNDVVKREIKFSRRNIFQRDRNICQYCGKRFPRNELTIDHVIPRSRGGRDTWDNLVLACVACNVQKSDRMPHEAQMHLMKSPAKPKWMPHLGVKFSRYPVSSWQKFVDSAYWDVELEEGSDPLPDDDDFPDELQIIDETDPVTPEK